MTIYKTVIIEDNPDNAAVLRKIITENHPDLTIVAEANSVASAKQVLLAHKPDIALLDIELTPGTSFDVLAELNQLNVIGFEIIFITAHQRYDYATKAIDFSSLAFLTKPIDPELLRGAIEKAKLKQTKKIQIDQLITKLQARDERNTQIIIPTTNHNKIAVFIADITYFEADDQTTIVHFQDHSTLPAFRILKHFEKMLKEDHPFFRVHNKLYINVAQVKSFKYKDLAIILKNGELLTASRRYGKDFKKYLDDFNGGGGFWNDFKNLFR
jgi:two-component system, LytTR family, response regulator